MSKKYVYTLTQTVINPDGTTTALFEAVATDGQGRHFERSTGADLPSICKRLGIEPPGKQPPEPVRSVRWTVADFGASRG